MDPNKALADIRTELDGYADAAAKARQAAEGDSNDDEIERLQTALAYADDLHDRMQNLDEWLTRGGFLPTPWASAEAPTAVDRYAADKGIFD